MYKKLLLVLLVLVLVNSVNASRETEWIADQSNQGVFGNMKDTAYGMLALNTETGYDAQILNGSRFLIDQLNSCMNSNTCDVEDTAIAVLALDDVGGNSLIVEEVGVWLLNSRSNVFTGELPKADNEWFVQVISNIGGECILTNTETGVSASIPVDVSGSYVPWYTVDNSILTVNTEDLNLDCSSLGSSNLVLSLINKKIDASNVENYYIKQEEHSKSNITVSFGDVCWGSSYRTVLCDTETTAHVLYALDKIGKSGDPTWLVEQDNLGLIEQGLLYEVTQDSQYLEDLRFEKNELGYWGSADLKSTATLYNVLKPDPIVNGVQNWVASRRDNANCWEKPSCSVEETSLVLYGGAYDVDVFGCPDLDGDNICDNDDSDVDGDGLNQDVNPWDPFPRNPDANNNGILDGDDDLDGDGTPNKDDNDIDGDLVLNIDDEDPWDPDVPGDDDDRFGGGVSPGDLCTTFEGCRGRIDTIGQCKDIEGDGCPRDDTGRSCEVGGFCVTSGGDSGVYTSSCTCISGSSGDSPGDGTDDTEDETEGSSVVLWVLLVLLLLIILVGGGFLAYKKGLLKFKFGKKPKPEAKYTPKLSQRKPQKYVPRMAARRKVPRVAKHIERELDQSMRDLEKLLGKK